MKQKTYTEQQLINFAKESNSIRQLLLKLNLIATGGSYSSIKKAIKENNIDISHFTGQAWNKNKSYGHKKCLDEYLSNRASISSHRLKLRLIEENILTHKCERCQINTWMNEKISLELHHIDGNPTNNTITNLQLLCPNCHSLTTNHGGKNKKSFKQKENKPKVNFKEAKQCLDCNKEINVNSLRCKPCSLKVKSKINWPDTKVLKEMLKTRSYVQIGKNLGVSDNAIRKRIVNYPE